MRENFFLRGKSTALQNLNYNAPKDIDSAVSMLASASAAVANALENAIGQTMSDLPLSPPKILEAIQNKSNDGK